jgi:solute carrier family 5 (high affinity choline transporter), member 7
MQNLKPFLALLVFFLLSAIASYYFTDGDIFWPGFVAMMVFYALVFYMGTYFAKQKQENENSDFLLAGRSMPLVISVFTMAATWIGGGYINGSAEYTASSGLIWVQAPWGYALSLFVGGLVFARPMRRRQYTTMLDPIEARFGKKAAALFFLPALTGEIFWSGAILTALGTTFGVVLGIDTQTSIVLSAMVTIAYTAIGGLWAVALTDVVQLLLLAVGLMITLPFALQSVGGLEVAWAAYVEKKGATATMLPSREALGSYYWNWWDNALLLIFGGIPWQVYFQRVLSAKNEKTAMWLSIIAGCICLVMAIPSILIGIVGDVANWEAMGLQPPPTPSSTLPWVIRYLTNPWVATIGLGAVAAAVMSSVDSSILSASSMAGWNIYRPLVKPDITAKNLIKVIQRCVWIIGIAATLLALQVNSIYALWFLCSDFVYCLLFPALVCALFDPKANRVGALAGFAVAFILRFGGGEPTLGIPVLLPYPMIEDGVVLFPYRTLAMVSGLVTMVVVSRVVGLFAARRV